MERMDWLAGLCAGPIRLVNMLTGKLGLLLLSMGECAECGEVGDEASEGEVAANGSADI